MRSVRPARLNVNWLTPTANVWVGAFTAGGAALFEAAADADPEGAAPAAARAATASPLAASSPAFASADTDISGFADASVFAPQPANVTTSKRPARAPRIRMREKLRLCDFVRLYAGLKFGADAQS
ncbi:hypothetical protein GCM10009827_096010 [Dactylosporangium maewongense]|uniref:Uncharacterized protein n=1 Tax=Dactylosporangium maewongense TaxID=634393 RepID=A0ABN2CNS7_9ACTN